jgi:DNA topoisomerase-2
MSGRIVISELEDHIADKGMWAGSLKPEVIKDLYGITSDNKLVLLKGEHTPALLKCIDEILANATDHSKEITNAYPVRNIKVNIFESGQISIFNDGPGIPIEVHHQSATHSKLIERRRQIYTPEVIFTVPLAGSSDADRLDGAKHGVTKAGVNSLGAKICNIHSEEFIVETSDSVRKLKFKQICHGIRNITPPEITPYSAEELKNPNAASFTRITFTLNYERFGFTGGEKSRVISDLFLWLRYRTYLSAIYTGINVYFNDNLCPKNPRSFIELIFDTTKGHVLESRAVAMETPYNNHPWNVAAIIFNSEDDIPKLGKSLIRDITMVNGVVTLCGPHVNYIHEKITAEVCKLLSETSIAQSAIVRNIILVMTCPIINADWDGQSKDKLVVAKSIIEKYQLNPGFIHQLAVLCIKPYLDKLDSAKNKVKPSEKYTEARYAGKAQRHECSLFLAEGDSACSMVKNGLAKSNVPHINTDYCGYFSLQGVILNVAREMITTKLDSGETIYVKNSRIRDDVRLNQLRMALNLQYNMKYETTEELRTLNYGKIILCTDEDLDGVGKIAPLMLVYFYYFWPALFEKNIIYRFKTPLIRAYIPSTTNFKNFYTVQQYLEFNKEPGLYTQCNYYKGLAGHEDYEVKSMFDKKNFTLYCYNNSDKEECKRLFDVYFGEDPEKRKTVLRVPLEEFSIEQICEFEKRLVIDISAEQLNYNTKAYKLDAIKRQIPHIMDGLNPTRRKIVATSLIDGILPKKGQGVKVFKFAADVAKRMHYQHGEASINKTAVYLAQGFVNHRFYPLLTRAGEFGNRHGDPAGQPRYIGLRSSPLPEILFPFADMKLLKSAIEDGEEVEPEYYVAIVPFCILETTYGVSEGWANVTYGRSLSHTLGILKNYINGEIYTSADFSEIDSTKRGYMPPNVYGFTGELRIINGKIYSFGTYSVTEGANVLITITELPIGILTGSYYDTLNAPTIKDGKEIENFHKQYIKNIYRSDNGNKVRIEITLTTENYQAILTKFGNADFKPLEHFLRIYSCMDNSNLNFYSETGVVLEFRKNYLDALLYWAEARKKLYEARIIRGKIIVELKLRVINNIIRYLATYDEMGVSNVKTAEEMDKILFDRKFERLNEKFISNSEKTPTDQISAIAENGDYEYLTKYGCPRDFYKEVALSRERMRAKYIAALEKLNLSLSETPVGKTDWLEEIEKFEKIVQRGVETDFKFIAEE